MAVINSEGVKPGVNTKGARPTAASLLEGAGVTEPQPGVNNEGMSPTAHSLIRGAVKASRSEEHTSELQSR